VEVARVANTLAQELDQITKLLEKKWARDTAEANKSSRGHPDSLKYALGRIDAEKAAWKKNHQGFLDLLEFAKRCEVVVRKPKVNRGRQQDGHPDSLPAFYHKHRAVVPQIWLRSGPDCEKVEYRVETLHFVHHEQRDMQWGEDNAGNDIEKEVMTVSVPEIFQKFGGWFSCPVGNADDWEKALTLLFVQEAGENWQKVREQVVAAWNEVGTRLDAIVDGAFDKHGAKEKKVFREKFIKALVETKGLIEAPPDAVLAVFRLGWEEIEVLMKFTKRNQADIGLVDFEDVEMAQNEARVKLVMES
jgi:hypothetical protein